MPWIRPLGIVLLLTPVTFAADWPQWLGPKRDGSSSEKVAVWKEPLKILWRQSVGEGNSAPMIAAGRVFMHTKVNGKLEEQLAAYDAKSGKPLWNTPYERSALKTFYGNGPRGTPAFADGKVFTFGITGLLTCFDAAEGKLDWQVDTAKLLSPKPLIFGPSCSPLVSGKSVLLNVGGKGAAIAAFDRETGKICWKDLDDGASYASPILLGKQAVFLTQLGLVSLNPKDGDLLWRFPFKDTILESSTTPIQAGDLLIASSITLGSVGLRLENKDGKIIPTEVWKNPKLTCYFSTPVPVGKDQFYAVVGELSLNPFAKKKPKANLCCVETQTGKVLWTREKVGTYHASLLRTGDNKLLMLEEEGDLVLLAPNPKAYRELARSSICGKTWAHPALSDGRLFVRDEKELICVQLPAGK
jgi:outer membrane protein assembly factor BamB